MIDGWYQAMHTGGNIQRSVSQLKTRQSKNLQELSRKANNVKEQYECPECKTKMIVIKTESWMTIFPTCPCCMTQMNKIQADLDRWTDKEGK